MLTSIATGKVILTVIKFCIWSDQAPTVIFGDKTAWVQISAINFILASIIPVLDILDGLIRRKKLYFKFYFYTVL